jgi:hypothetical protein
MIVECTHGNPEHEWPCSECVTDRADEAIERAEKAEARVSKLESALRQILNDAAVTAWSRGIASAALVAPSGGEK